MNEEKQYLYERGWKPTPAPHNITKLNGEWSFIKHFRVKSGYFCIEKINDERYQLIIYDPYNSLRSNYIQSWNRETNCYNAEEFNSIDGCLTYVELMG